MRRLSGIPTYEAQAGLGEYFAATSGLGSAMQRGEGRDYRDGSLGMTMSFTTGNIIALAAGGLTMFALIQKGFVKI